MVTTTTSLEEVVKGDSGLDVDDLNAKSDVTTTTWSSLLVLVESSLVEDFLLKKVSSRYINIPPTPFTIL